MSQHPITKNFENFKARILTESENNSRSYGTGETNRNSGTYPRTGSECVLAARVTSRYRARLSSMLQFIFNLEKDSEAEAKTATSLAPAATAASKPWENRWKITNKGTQQCKLHVNVLTEKATYFEIWCQNRKSTMPNAPYG